MPVTARLSRRFYDTFGDEIANDLVEWFNQVDATYRHELREQNDLNWGRVEARIGQSESRFDARMSELESRFEVRVSKLESRFDARMTEVEARMSKMDLRFEARLTEVEARVRADMQVGFEKLRADLLKWMFLFWTGTALTVIGLSLRH